ncbi:DUF1559 family PulG-like putative transporter [Stratiformator vulcanicus]|uniref:DUF1559 domain-containing protein n=1 Tax=Stratiformator vulcanicus TaxID=2527980 RepID=A0A517QZT7_9PLAN|nr:DUF1559 domain-containing protein [Stratiformator vulcanicus]QDT37166.1 hypothetical protein Pan189_15380 [Stratiformator vulcanicus]
MRTPTKWFCQAAIVIALLLPQQASAADWWADYLPDEVFAVVVIDAESIKPQAVLNRIATEEIQQSPIYPQLLQSAIMAQGLLDATKVKQVVAVISEPTPMSKTHCVLALQGRDASPALINNLLGNIPTPPGRNGEPGAAPKVIEIATVGDDRVLALELPSLLEGAKKRSEPYWQLDEIEKALKSVPTGGVRGVVMPTAEQKALARQQMPPGKKPFDELGRFFVSENLQWGAMGLTLGNEVKLKFIAKTPSTESAAEGVKLVSEAVNDKTSELSKAMSDPQMLVPSAEGDRMVLEFDGTETVAFVKDTLIRPAVKNAKAAAERSLMKNRLKQMMLSLHNFHDNYRSFPAPAVVDADKKPLLSWRVEMLPFLDEYDLYKEFRKDESWDSPHNKQLLSEMPDVFKTAGSEEKEGYTRIVAPVGDGMMFEKGKKFSIRDVTDGTSNTIMVLLANEESAVPWTKPDDLKIDLKKPLKGLDGQFDGTGFLCALADGSVRFISYNIGLRTLKNLLQRNDGQVIGEF